MTTKYAENHYNSTEGGATILGLFNITMENFAVNGTEEPSGIKGPLPIIISLVCMFLLLATCLVFMTLCKPDALDQSLYGPRECMPYHAENASEPQLKLWKRLGSLRHSIRSFRQSRTVSQLQRPCPRRTPAIQDWSFMESTKM
ncbi:hypothetical protein GDO86_013143 [Hymenochirus boettgeri]|uniref:Uncharacterized protein n=1 Tax=Hymenochirus boettgeri TaxID=247094 RepID=A0A8T2IU26_9PIPI|nr:hypothetical protein GDO86_013143 [Hymenochirus boettgeri]